MPDLAPRVHDRLALAGTAWEQTLWVAAGGREQLGFLAADGWHVLTAPTEGAVHHVAPAFADIARVPGRWPAAATPAATAGPVTVLRLGKRRRPRNAAGLTALDAASRGLVPVRSDDGLAGWAVLHLMGEVPRKYNPTQSELHVARVDRLLGALPAGTPVFHPRNGACMGLLVPHGVVIDRELAPLHVIAAVEGGMVPAG